MQNILSPWCQACLLRAERESKDSLGYMYEQIFDSNSGHYTEAESYSIIIWVYKCFFSY